MSNEDQGKVHTVILERKSQSDGQCQGRRPKYAAFVCCTALLNHEYAEKEVLHHECIGGWFCTAVSGHLGWVQTSQCTAIALPRSLMKVEEPYS